ncbi:hypothetical protein IV203_030930 [Nitzschia inconspicua]|uniref:Subtilisin n=1 Tax=Nitzschia inconspicua TaxID=303405 RepID=A0A9K3Q1P6_9STRA|nr:hypothetical protein IV203_030930 [Nitzschia inconspicua]
MNLVGGNNVLSTTCSKWRDCHGHGTHVAGTVKLLLKFQLKPPLLSPLVLLILVPPTSTPTRAPTQDPTSTPSTNGEREFQFILVTDDYSWKENDTSLKSKVNLLHCLNNP